MQWVRHSTSLTRTTTFVLIDMKVVIISATTTKKNPQIDFPEIPIYISASIAPSVSEIGWLHPLEG